MADGKPKEFNYLKLLLEIVIKCKAFLVFLNLNDNLQAPKTF